MEFNYDYREDNDGDNINEQIILTPGPASFKVKSVQDRDKRGNQLLTKNGDPKIRIDILATDINQNSTLVYEHITAKTGWKLGQILKSIGKGQLYTKEGSLDPRHLVGGKGQCIVKTKADPGFPMATVIDKYMPAATAAPIEELPPLHTYEAHANAGFGDERDELEDDLPF